MSELMRRRYNMLYSRIKGRSCVYCGRPSTETDHIPPINSVASRGSEYFTNRGVQLIAVPSCRVCNSILGALSLDTFEDRQKHLSNLSKKIRTKEVDQRDRHEMKKLEERVEKIRIAKIVRKVLKHLRATHDPKDLKFWKAISGR